MHFNSATSKHLKCCDAADSSSLFAIYRKLNGSKVFTGMVSYDQSDRCKFKKLDDPTGELNGPSHVMDEIEVIAQFSLYDDTTLEVGLEIECCLFTNKDDDITAKDVTFFESFVDSPQFEKIAFFPHNPMDIRADDMVVVKASGTAKDDDGDVVPAFERFWAEVLAITPCGRIIARSHAQLHWSPIALYQKIVFPIEAVIASKKGIYW